MKEGLGNQLSRYVCIQSVYTHNTSIYMYVYIYIYIYTYLSHILVMYMCVRVNRMHTFQHGHCRVLKKDLMDP